MGSVDYAVVCPVCGWEAHETSWYHNGSRYCCCDVCGYSRSDMIFYEDGVDVNYKDVNMSGFVCKEDKPEHHTIRTVYADYKKEDGTYVAHDERGNGNPYYGTSVMICGMTYHRWREKQHIDICCVGRNVQAWVSDILRADVYYDENKTPWAVCRSIKKRHDWKHAEDIPVEDRFKDPNCPKIELRIDYLDSEILNDVVTKDKVMLYEDWKKASEEETRKMLDELSKNQLSLDQQIVPPAQPIPFSSAEAQKAAIPHIDE